MPLCWACVLTSFASGKRTLQHPERYSGHQGDHDLAVRVCLLSPREPLRVSRLYRQDDYVRTSRCALLSVVNRIFVDRRPFNVDSVPFRDYDLGRKIGPGYASGNCLAYLARSDHGHYQSGPSVACTLLL